MHVSYEEEGTCVSYEEEDTCRHENHAPIVEVYHLQTKKMGHAKFLKSQCTVTL